MSNQHLLLFSLIFTTMNDQLTGATGKLGIFGRTLSQINNDLSKGKFASLFHLVPKSEITALQSYGQALLSNSNKIKNWDKALAKGKINQQTYNQTIENTVGSLKGLSTTSQLLGIKIKQLHSDFLAGKMSASEFTMQVNTLIGAQKAATVATQVLGTALRTAFNIGIGIAISAIISWIQDLITENQRMAEISKQAADEIKDELNGLEDYSEKIISLRKELESTNTTTERATDVRQELYDIQKDLIENYGAEKDSIDLVTGSIKDQIEELKNLGKQKYDSQYYSNYQATQTTLGNLNNLDLVLDDRAWRDYANQMWQNSNASRFRDDVQDYMKSVLESAGFKYEGGFYKLDGNAFDVNDALVSVEKQVEQAINNLDINNYPNPAAYADAEKQLRHVLEYLSAVNKDVTSPLIEHEEELAQYIKYNEKYSEQYWKLFTARANYESAQERGIQEEIIAARKAFIDTYNALVIDEEDNAVSWWFEKEFGEITNESEKAANTVKQITYPVKESLDELNTQLEEVYNSFDTAFSNQSTIQSAFDKIQSGTDLTASEMRGLIKLCKKDFPEIGTLFTKTAKGYTISADDLVKANTAIMESTKDTVRAQIEGYQEVVNAYEGRKFDDKGFAENLGVTEQEYNDAKQQIENLNLVLKSLGLTLEETTNKAEKLSKELSDKVKLIASAMKEMTDDGHISASTYAELVEKGGNFTECLEVQNGKLVLNIDKLKELEKQEYLNIVAENNLQIAKLETIERTSSNAKAIWEEINALKEENALYLQMANEIDDAGKDDKTKTSKTEDPIKEAFEKEMKDIEHLHNMGLASDKEYYDALEKANEKHYKNSVDHESDYLSNVEKIYKARQSLYKDDADKQFDDLEDQYKRGIITAEQYAQGLHDLGQELYGESSIYGGTEFAIKALEELDKKVKEVSGDIYDELKDNLSADGDRLLENVLADADELSNKNIELFKDTSDLKTFKKNAEDIFKTVSTSALDALERGLITPERYKEIIDKYSQELDSGVIQDAFDDAFDKIVDKGKEKLGNLLITPDEYSKLIDEWGEKLNIAQDVIDSAKELSEDDYLDAWDFQHGYDETDSEKNYKLRAERIKYIYDLAEKLYGKNGQKNVKAYYALIKEGLEAENDLLKDRLSAEKEYWEERKDAKLKIFDDEIKRLEEIQDEEEKVNKAEELRLNLIKARENLEKAKSQRNQLIFVNGTYQYDVDQDAVMSAQEEVSDALKAIKDEELQTQISLLEEQKENAEKFYQDIIDKIDSYEKSLEGVLSSDSDTLNAVFGESNTVLADADKFDKENVDTVKTTEEVSDISTDIKGIAKTAFDIMTFLSGGATFESLVKALGGNVTPNSKANFMDSFASTLVGKQITPSTVAGVTTNNNSTNNNNQSVVFSGDINVNVELSLQSLDDFVGDKIDDFGKRVIAAIKQKMPAVLAKA